MFIEKWKKIKKNKKKKTLDANARSAYQLLELFIKDKDQPKSCRCTPKSDAILFPKSFVPLYLEDLRFLKKRCCWKVKKNYTHFISEQSRFKRDFVLNNQHKRQKVKTSIEKEFYKLINNANFGYDCRNNANNAKFQPIIDKVNEITYIKKYNLLRQQSFKICK